MSRQKKSSGSGLGCLILLAGALYLFVKISDFISEHRDAFITFGTMFAIAIIVIVPSIFISKYLNKRDERARQKKIEEYGQRSQHESVLRSLPALPQPKIISTSTNFFCSEERRINLLFRDLLNTDYKIKSLQAQLKHEQELSRAHRGLGQITQAMKLEESSYSKNNETNRLRTTLLRGITFPKYPADENMVDLINSFYRLKSSITGTSLRSIGNLFDSPQSAVLSHGPDSAFIFTIYYVILYEGTHRNLRIIKYPEIKISHQLFTEKVGDTIRPDDEFARYGWMHETKTGEPDRRYRENFRCSYVYRGQINIAFENYDAHISATNSSKTRAIENDFLRHQQLAAKKYCKYIDQLLRGYPIDQGIGVLDKDSKDYDSHKHVNESIEHILATSPIDTNTVSTIDTATSQRTRIKGITGVERKHNVDLEHASFSYHTFQQDNRKQEKLVLKPSLDSSLSTFSDTGNVNNNQATQTLITESDIPGPSTSALDDTRKQQKDGPKLSEEISANGFLFDEKLESFIANQFIIKEGRLVNYFGQAHHINIPRDTNAIDERVFAYNPFLHTVTVPDGLVKIGSRAFYSCPNLNVIYLPDSVTDIASDAFINSPKLTLHCNQNSFSAWYAAKYKITTTHPQSKAGTLNPANDIMSISEPDSSRSGDPQIILPQDDKEYRIVDTISDLPMLSLEQDTNIISNNIFSITFRQDHPISASIKEADFELFFIDDKEKLVSDVQIIKADRTEDQDPKFKKTFSLLSNLQVHKGTKYFLVIRYKNGGRQILEKIPFSVEIEFASLFDW